MASSQELTEVDNHLDDEERKFLYSILAPLIQSENAPIETITEMLDLSEDVNVIIDNDGNSPLHLAVEANRFDLCKLLVVNYSADVNICSGNSKAETPLTIAACGYVSNHIFSFLIDKGAKVNQPDGSSYFPIHLLVIKYARSYENLFENQCEKLRYLLLQDAFDVNSLTSDDCNCLHLFTLEPEDDDDEAICMEILKMLIKQGIYLNQLDVNGNSPLHEFCSNGFFNFIELMLQHDVDIATQNFVTGETPLHRLLRASFGSNEEDVVIRIITSFVKRGLNINTTSFAGETVLQTFCENSCSIEILHVLTSLGANYDITCIQGKTPLHGFILDQARKYKFLKSDPETISFQCCRSIMLEMKQNGMPGTSDEDDEEFSMLSKEFKYFMLAHVHTDECRPNGQPSDEEEFLKNSIEFLNVLLNNNLSVDEQDINGYTALILASDMGNFHQVNQLLQVGANVNITDKYGRTALHHFLLLDNGLDEDDKGEASYDILKCLLEYGIDTEVTDVFGKKATDYVSLMHRDHQSVVKKYFSDCLLPEAVVENDIMVCENMRKSLEAHFSLQNVFPGSESPRTRWNDSVSLVRDILNTKGIGRVNIHQDFDFVSEQLHKFVGRLCIRMSTEDELLSYNAKISGSVSERTKVGLPDEFDYLVYVGGLECLVDPENVDTAPGYMRLKVKNNIDDTEPSYKRFLDADGYFNAYRFTHHFNKIIMRVMKQESLWHDFRFHWDYMQKNPLSNDGTANFLIKLVVPFADFGEVEISIDFVPVFKLPTAESVSKNLSTMAKKIVEENPDKNLCLVLKKYLTNEYKRDNIQQLRLSFSEFETVILRSTKNYMQDAYVLIKTLKELHMFNVDLNMLTTFIETYAVKTLIMEEIAATQDVKTAVETDDNSSKNKTVELSVKLLNKLNAALRAEYLSSFFIPDLNVFDSLENEFECNAPDNLVEHIIRRLDLEQMYH